MNCNNYRKVVHAAIWFGNKIALSKILKECYHKNYWSDAGGKVEKDESLIYAVYRETLEETGLDLLFNQFELIDCYIYPKRKLKTFLFEVKFKRGLFSEMLNSEPHKHSEWSLFTKQEALKLRLLMPSVRYYLSAL